MPLFIHILMVNLYGKNSFPGRHLASGLSNKIMQVACVIISLAVIVR